eukprot:2663611-Pleurochrysis_carterae.AAC.1
MSSMHIVPVTQGREDPQRVTVLCCATRVALAAYPGARLGASRVVYVFEGGGARALPLSSRLFAHKAHALRQKHWSGALRRCSGTAQGLASESGGH